MASNREDCYKPIENKLISPRQLRDFHSKRQNESHLPQLALAIHFGQCESSSQKLAANVVKIKLN